MLVKVRAKREEKVSLEGKKLPPGMTLQKKPNGQLGRKFQIIVSITNPLRKPPKIQKHISIQDIGNIDEHIAQASQILEQMRKDPMAAAVAQRERLMERKKKKNTEVAVNGVEGGPQDPRRELELSRD